MRAAGGTMRSTRGAAWMMTTERGCELPMTTITYDYNDPDDCDGDGDGLADAFARCLDRIGPTYVVVTCSYKMERLLRRCCGNVSVFPAISYVPTGDGESKRLCLHVVGPDSRLEPAFSIEPQE